MRQENLLAWEETIVRCPHKRVSVLDGLNLEKMSGSFRDKENFPYDEVSSTVTISAFFTVSIIYNAKASEAEKITDANNSNKVAQRCKEFQLAGGKPVGNLKL